MMKKRTLRSLLIYEVKNVCGNPFTIFFSTAFPILMLFLMNATFMKQIPEEFRAQEVTRLFITMIMIIPMSILLIGHGANYAQELEKDVPLRMNLFGFNYTGMMAAKMLANFIFLTAALVLYVCVGALFVEILVPDVRAALINIVALYLLAGIFFVMSHAVATLVKRFGPTYAITMLVYFIFMILCGMFGIQNEMLPGWVRNIAALLPMTYINRDFVDFWQGGSYNFGPFLQALIFLAAVSGVLWFFGARKGKRVIK